MSTASPTAKPSPPYRIWVGWDADQMVACNVAQHSFRMTSASPLHLNHLMLGNLQARELYYRPTRQPSSKQRGYWDVISDAPMSTGHAIARFLIPTLCGFEGWACFTDGDVIVRRDIAELFALADPQYAVQVVQHTHEPTATVKMQGEIQTRYSRKNWSSCILWHCGHLANRALTVDLVNTLPGRDLHRFCWLKDEEIGALPADWNVLVGEQTHPNPAIAHFTLGTPNMPGFEYCDFSDEWFRLARACGYHLTRPPKETEGAA